MAVLAYKGDLRRLSCDAWYLPGDFRPFLNPIWTEDDDQLAAAAHAAKGRLPEDWGETGTRVLALHLEDRRRATPVLAAIPLGGTNDWRYHRETLRQFIRLAKELERPEHLCARPRRLLAVPLIGTGLSAWRPDSAQHLKGLLQALHEESDQHDVDVVVVVRGDAHAHWSALQALRRRWLQANGGDRELQGLAAHAERLAALAQDGKLVLFTGAGVGLPAGLPDWRGLLRQLAQWAGYDAATTERLLTMDLLDQAALIAVKQGEAQLADQVASLLSVPHHALSHGLLANLPVRENVTLNYDSSSSAPQRWPASRSQSCRTSRHVTGGC